MDDVVLDLLEAGNNLGTHHDRVEPDSRVVVILGETAIDGTVHFRQVIMGQPVPLNEQVGSQLRFVLGPRSAHDLELFQVEHLVLELQHCEE